MMKLLKDFVASAAVGLLMVGLIFTLLAPIP